MKDRVQHKLRCCVCFSSKVTLADAWERQLLEERHESYWALTHACECWVTHKCTLCILTERWSRLNVRTATGSLKIPIWPSISYIFSAQLVPFIMQQFWYHLLQDLVHNVGFHIPAGHYPCHSCFSICVCLISQADDEQVLCLMEQRRDKPLCTSLLGKVSNAILEYNIQLTVNMYDKLWQQVKRFMDVRN